MPRGSPARLGCSLRAGLPFFDATGRRGMLSGTSYFALVRNMKRIACIVGISLVLVLSARTANGSGTSSLAGLGITRITVAQRRVVFGGKSFGNVGQYELLTGIAYGELDPKAAGNAGIVNLSNAPV